MKKHLLTLAAFTLLQGCIPHMIMASQDREHYSQYQLDMAKLNTEREKSGLQPNPVQTFEEWKGKK